MNTDRITTATQNNAVNIDIAIETLISDARHLAYKMQQLADRLAANNGYAPNSLGEVQGLGLDIDRGCVELHNLRMQERTLRYLAKDAE